MVVRLQRIYAALHALVGEHRPDMIAIERVFLHRNPDSALKLGQARGVALCAAASLGASVHEYAPRAIKMAVTGYGAAAKPQVAQMVSHAAARWSRCWPPTPPMRSRPRCATHRPAGSAHRRLLAHPNADRAGSGSVTAR